MKRINTDEMSLYYGGSSDSDICKIIALAGFTLSSAFFLVTLGIGALVIAGVSFYMGRDYCPGDDSGGSSPSSARQRGPR